jgi:hypothetical protein
MRMNFDRGESVLYFNESYNKYYKISATSFMEYIMSISDKTLILIQ